MNHVAAVLLVTVVSLLIPYPPASLGTLPKGILVRPQDVLQTEQDITTFITLCENYRITHIFLMVKQDTGPDSGLVYYNSSRTPRKSDFDVLLRTIEKAHERKIKVYAWIPLLYDKWLSEQGMGIRDNWISPLKSLSYYSTIVEEIQSYPVDGIFFDYLWFPDDFAASEQLKTDFGQKFGYSMGSVDLSLEKERNTPLWSQWVSYRSQVLSDFLTAIMPETVPVGVNVIAEELQEYAWLPPALVTFVTVQPAPDPTPLINRWTLLTEEAVYVVIRNEYVSEVRQQILESVYADMLLFDGETWDEQDFMRIRKAELPFTHIRMTTLPFIDFFNEEYDMAQWRLYEANTAVLPAGHVFGTYFKYEPYKEKWSAYTAKFNRDYVEEMISEARQAGLYAVLKVDIQSQEYVTRYKDAASITYQWGTMRERICLVELNKELYKTEFFDMVSYLAGNYDAEAVLITNMWYLEDCFCTECLRSYIDFMAEKGVPMEDWPRADGEINIYDQTVGEWKTAQITTFLKELKVHLQGLNKELWVEAPVSSNLEYTSAEYGMHLPELEKIADRIVLINIDLENPPRIEYIVKSLPTPSKYILSFFIESSVPPTRIYLEGSLKGAHDQGITSVGVYPQSTITDTLWGAFYIAYSYRLALTDEDLMDIYEMGDYGSVISTYDLLEEEKKEKEHQNRENARQSINEAKRTYEKIPPTLEDAKQLDVNVADTEAEIRQALNVLSEAEELFINGEYELAEEKGKKAVIEFSTLKAKIESDLENERVNRVTSGVVILVVFLLIMMYVRFKMRHAK